MIKCTLKTLYLLIWLGLFPAIGEAKGEKIIIGGSNWNQIAVIDKASGAVEWTHGLAPGNECNTVAVDGKRVLFSYKQGARLIDRSGKVAWDYPTVENTEVQYAGTTSTGYVLGICGNPSRIVELDKKGRVIHEIAFETGTEQPHGQFRQIHPMGDGSYLVPLLSQGAVITVGHDGKVLNRVAVEGKPFSVTMYKGNLIVSGGDGHCATETTPEGKVLRRINQDDIPGISLGYVAQIHPLDNGNWLICNWLGHGADAAQPHLIEIDPAGNVVWSFNDKTNVEKVSTAQPFR